MAKKGSKWAIDMNRITVKEYRALFAEPKIEQDDEDGIVAKAAGLTVEDLLSLGQREYRELVREFFRLASEPLADPN